ncbi:thioesterase-like protein, putative [Bodo saltans]|uniref:Thioesterase-like protein, putative n=1 Tax=Bodo saltans TaxID=75058 RepID=A0A0S4IK08_BODSA|nr:thioesterase-like protein, putative [Bodo saltans]|eukprot:CUE99435.1 thioesterase-like protein, putative [Bodo saltans]
MVLFHGLRVARYIARGRFFGGPKLGVFDEVTTHVYAGFRMMDAFMHVNNARYLELFEFARWHEAGVKRSISAFKAAGIYPTIGAVHVQFIKEVPPASLVMIRSRIVSLEDRTFVIRQHMFNKSGTKLHATALFRMSLIDSRGAKPATLSAEEAIIRLGFQPDEIRSFVQDGWLKDLAVNDDGSITTPLAQQQQQPLTGVNAESYTESALRVLKEVNDMDMHWRRLMRRLQNRIKKPSEKTEKRKPPVQY